MIYLFQTTCYAALLFGIYLLFLRHRAAHAWSRAWLLMCAMLPFALPFISIPGVQATFAPATVISTVELPVITIWGGQATTGTTSFVWLPLVYAGICALLLGRILAQYIWFARFVRRHTYQSIDGAQVLHDDGIEPGSFGRYIFLPGAATDDAILQHELAHIKLRHSADIIIMRLLQAVFWPNVMLYVIAHELRLVHEFQADAHSATNKDSYIAMLLNSTFGTKHFSMSHTFFHHPLKRRIMMLQKTAPGRKGAFAIAIKTCGIAVILVAGIIWLQSCRPEPQNQVSNAASATGTVREYKDKDGNPITVVTLSGKKPDTIHKSIEDITGRPANDQKHSENALAHMIEAPTPNQIVPTDNVERTADGKEVYKVVDKAPAPGYNVSQYLATNIKYPESAKKAKIEGRVIVKFIVGDDGAVYGVRHINEVDWALATEAVRVISSMPKWTPGEHHGKKVSVAFILPVAFRLN